MNNEITIHNNTHTASEFIKVLDDALEHPEKYDSIRFTEYLGGAAATETLVYGRNVALHISEIALAYENGLEIRFCKVPERVAKMPDAAVFWVRPHGIKNTCLRLVTKITDSRCYMGENYLEFTDALQYEWSPDRKNWFNF